MPARAAFLCTRLLPTRKDLHPARAPGEPFCRFHNDTRSRAIAEHDQRMFALGDELDAMTISQLLETVHDQLANIGSVVRTYGEARLAVIVAVQRLAELTSEGFQITRIPSSMRSRIPMESPIESMTRPQPPAESATAP